jgi:hypothetical protein
VAAPSSLDAAIDRLYQASLDDFVSVRKELAGQARGEEARTIRALAKPNLVAWALNQVYWTSRPVFDRLLQCAAMVRQAQAAALLGRPHDLRGADAAHRQALDDAVRRAVEVLDASGHPATSDARRLFTAAFEALPWADRAGRLTTPPSPQGFAALAGLSLGADAPVAETHEEAAPVRREPAPRAARPAGRAQKPALRDRERERREREERAGRERRFREERERREERDREERARTAVEQARAAASSAAGRLGESESRLAGAQAEEQAARERLETARRARADAEAALREIEREAKTAGAALQKAESELQRVAPKPRT